MSGKITNKVWHVYVDRTLDDRAFYVGKGDKHRIKQKRRNRYWKFIANKYGFTREVILTTKDEKFAFEQEIEWIAKLKTFINGPIGSWGANMSQGGEGPSGFKRQTPYTEESLDKMRVSKLGDKNPAYGKPGNRLGASHDSETMLTKMRHRKCGVETIEKLSGENGSGSILTWKSVNEIRFIHSSENKTHKALAVQFGVSQIAIYKIIRNKSWKDPLYIPKNPKLVRRTRKDVGQMSNAKLVWQNIVDIRQRYNDGQSSTTLAKEFNIGKTAVWNIVNFKTWKSEPTS